MVYGTTKGQFELIGSALEEEFEKLYKKNYTKIMRLCLGYVSGDQDRAKDLTQEVFIKVWSSMASFRKESAMTTWLYRIAVNTCLMNLRKTRSQRLTDKKLQDTAIGTNESEIKEKQFQEMYRCIHTLAPTNKAIILMELEGLPQKEIAEVMGLKHEAIRTRIHRIKNELSKCVRHE